MSDEAGCCKSVLRCFPIILVQTGTRCFKKLLNALPAPCRAVDVVAVSYFPRSLFVVYIFVVDLPYLARR
jgi:hypothetical protein